ncbi:MAG: hypothetical protein ABIK65_13105 [Candidatus Eisenbacteria bacterium]
MTCATCGSANAIENCYRCDSWICEECAQDHEGYYVCQICYGEMTGESYDEEFDDDLDFEGEKPEKKADGDDVEEDDEEDCL